MEDVMGMGVRLDDIAHIIQVALTPVFLLSGIAALLNVITARLGRVLDQAGELRQEIASAPGPRREAALRHSYRALRRRLLALDCARVCGALAGAGTCAATFALFLGALQSAGVATALFLLFGSSVLFTLAAMLGFLVEVLLSCRHDGLPELRSHEDP